MTRRPSCPLVLLLVLAGARGAGAQPSQPPRDREAEIAIEISASDMVRRTAVFVTAGQAVNRAADAAIDAVLGAQRERKPGDVLIRLARLWFVNLPVAALAEGAAHDSGHFARDAEFSNVRGRRHIKQWPWPVPIAVSVEYVGVSSQAEAGPRDALAVLGGGEQAAALGKQRLADQIYRHDASGYFDSVLFAYSSLDYPVYAWSDFGGGLGVPGDFQQYTRLLTILGPVPTVNGGASNGGASTIVGLAAFERNEDRLRSGAWLNLLDFSLWQSIERVGRYVATGQRVTSNATLNVHGLRLVPAAYATLGSEGPERGVDVRVVSSAMLTRVDVRRITTPSDQSLWGTGVAIRSRDMRRFLPEANLDVWQRAGRGAGFRIEAGTAHAMTFAKSNWDASVRLGYKTEGYLLDAPQRATLLATFQLSSRF